MSKFGWSYPAGAEHDPNAPWNQQSPPDVDVEDPTVGEDEECPHCGDVAYWTEEKSFTGWDCGNCDWEQEAVAEDFESTDTSLEEVNQ